jgi:hypothetical protein
MVVEHIEARAEQGVGYHNVHEICDVVEKAVLASGKAPRTSPEGHPIPMIGKSTAYTLMHDNHLKSYHTESQSKQRADAVNPTKIDRYHSLLISDTVRNHLASGGGMVEVPEAERTKTAAVLHPSVAII